MQRCAKEVLNKKKLQQQCGNETERIWLSKRQEQSGENYRTQARETIKTLWHKKGSTNQLKKSNRARTQ